MKMISSRHNPLARRVRDAMHDPEDEIVIEGRKQVEDALAAGWTPLALVTRGPLRDDATAFTPELYDTLAGTRSPQDLLGLFARPRHEARDILQPGKPPVVALDAVQDPGNVGTIIRLAAAFDCAGIVLLPGCADPWSPKSVRASVGTVLTVPVAHGTTDDLLGSGLALFAADGAGAAVDPPSRDVVFVFGNEGSGVSPEISGAATLIAIPMSARVESLNVAASAAILLSRSYAGRDA